ncbi:TPA: hypothetical protein ACGWHD_002943 [Serratia liquefaciens]
MTIHTDYLGWVGGQIQTHATDAKRCCSDINVEASSAKLTCPRNRNVAYNNDQQEIPSDSTRFLEIP